MKFIDKGTIELIGPYGLEKSLTETSRRISQLDTGVITSYALYILVGLTFYLAVPYFSVIDHSYILLLLIGLLSTLQKESGSFSSYKKMTS